MDDRTMIVVRGDEKVGKSSSIRLAYDELAQEFTMVCELGGTKKNEEINSGKEINGGILLINGVLVGFASKGDLPKNLEDWMKPLITPPGWEPHRCFKKLQEVKELLGSHGCAVIVCASHPAGSSAFRFVEKMVRESKPPFKSPVLLEKTRLPEAQKKDGWQAMAKDIIKEVRKAVGLPEQQDQPQLVEA